MNIIGTDKRTLEKFSLTMFVASSFIGSLLLIRHKGSFCWFYISAFLFFLLAFINAALLKPVYTLWMRIAFILSWVNTRLILIILFYLVFTPMSLFFRLLRIDFLDRKLEKNKDSYWKIKEKKDFNLLDYERQF